MEVRVFKNGNDYGSHKPALVVRLSDTGVIQFPYESCVRTFKSLYGNDCIIEFVVL